MAHTTNRRCLLRGAAVLSAGMASYWTPFARHSARAQEGSIRFGVSGPFNSNNAAYGRIWQQAMNLALVGGHVHLW